MKKTSNKQNRRFRCGHFKIILLKTQDLDESFTNVTQMNKKQDFN